jgi:hypothetical protein
MTIFDRLRNRRPASDIGAPETSPADEHPVPIPGYDGLDVKKLFARLPELSQVELAAVETYERSHKDRSQVLDKLRYMRGSEPLPGYDALDSEEVVEALTSADTQTVKAVRDYERKFRHRRPVMDEAGRALPTSQANVHEERAREQQETLVREGFAGRANTAAGLATDRPASDGRQGRNGLGPDS